MLFKQVIRQLGIKLSAAVKLTLFVVEFNLKKEIVSIVARNLKPGEKRHYGAAVGRLAVTVLSHYGDAEVLAVFLISLYLQKA